MIKTQILPVTVQRLYTVENLLWADGGSKRIGDPITATRLGGGSKKEMIKYTSFPSFDQSSSVSKAFVRLAAKKPSIESGNVTELSLQFTSSV